MWHNLLWMFQTGQKKSTITYSDHAQYRLQDSTQFKWFKEAFICDLEEFVLYKKNVLGDKNKPITMMIEKVVVRNILTWRNEPKWHK